MTREMYPLLRYLQFESNKAIRREPEKIQPASSWTLPPTGRQLSAIARLCQQLGIKEPLEDKPSNRWEARQLMYELNEKGKQKGW